MPRTLITGDAGFIGFHASMHLLDEGHQVHGVDGLTDYYDPQLKRDRLSILEERPGFTRTTCMLEDAEQIREVFDAFRPELVIHLAAQAGVRYSLENPAAYISSNINGTFNVLEAAKEFRPSHLLIASTSSVYGGNERIPFAETDRADFPVSLYAATKKSTEAMAHSYAHLWQLPITCFRFFTVYGPWGRPDMALFKFVRAIDAGEPIDVYGMGQMARDFTYIRDLVAAIAALASRIPESGAPVSEHDSMSPVAPFRVVNIGGGNPTGLMEFIDAIESALGRQAERNLLPMQQGDVIATHADATLLRELIGTVSLTPVTEGVREFVSWFRSYYRADR